MITATKNGIQRTFSDNQWKRMPKDKFGWIAGGGIPQSPTSKVDPTIVEKKMVEGKVDVTAIKNIPDEIIQKKVKTIKKTGGKKK